MSGEVQREALRAMATDLAAERDRYQDALKRIAEVTTPGLRGWEEAHRVAVEALEADGAPDPDYPDVSGGGVPYPQSVAAQAREDVRQMWRTAFGTDPS